MTEQTEPIEEFNDSTPESTDEVYETAEMADDSEDFIEVSNGDELWDELDLGAFLTDSSDEESYETDDAEVDDASYDDTAFPSDDEVADADYEDSDNLEVEEEEEEINDDDYYDIDLDVPAPLSRRKAEKVVKGIIEPLRDPNTPIHDVISSLAEFHPSRTQELAEAIVSESVATYPDEWLRHITGLDVTVDQILDWAVQGGSSPSNTAPVTVEDSGAIDALQAELTEIYGTNWQNSQFDHELMEADVPVVKALRAQLAQNEAYTALQNELANTRYQLEQLQPQIEDIKTAQEAEYEQAVTSSFTNEVEEYRGKVEGNSIPHVLEAYGLSPSESDTEEVAEIKGMLYAKFQPVEGYGSEFDIFLEKQFSGKESMQKAMNRVGDYLIKSSKLEADARRTNDANQAHQLQLKARGFKEQALLEQDALTVWTRKATAEFLNTSYVSPILRLLEQNADMQRRLQYSGRPEIVGQTTAIGGGGLQARLQDAKSQGTNPFDVDISDILGGR